MDETIAETSIPSNTEWEFHEKRDSTIYKIWCILIWPIVFIIRFYCRIRDFIKRRFFCHPYLLAPLFTPCLTFRFPFIPDVNILEAIAFLVITGGIVASGMGSHFGGAIEGLFAATLIMIPRYNFLTWLFGIPFERLVKYHRWFGYTIIVPFLYHGIQYAGTDLVDWFDGKTNISGTVSLICYIGILLTSVEIIRRHAFEYFYYLHFLFIPCLIAGGIHDGTFVAYMVPFFIMYAIDIISRIIRYFRSSTRVIRFDKYSGGVVKLTIKKKFSYKPGQYVFVNAPSLSWLQWHPFSISSSPMEKYTTFHVRGFGGWSNNLARMKAEKAAAFFTESGDKKSEIENYHNEPGQSSLEEEEEEEIRQEREEGSSTSENSFSKSTLSKWIVQRWHKIRDPGLTIKIDGPFGKPSIDFKKYNTLVFASAGIGATPLFSVFKDIYLAKMHGKKDHSYGRTTSYKPVRKVYFLWTLRQEEHVDWLREELERIVLEAQDKEKQIAYLDEDNVDTINISFEDQERKNKTDSDDSDNNNNNNNNNNEDDVESTSSTEYSSSEEEKDSWCEDEESDIEVEVVKKEKKKKKKGIEEGKGKGKISFQAHKQKIFQLEIKVFVSRPRVQSLTDPEEVDNILKESEPKEIVPIVRGRLNVKKELKRIKKENKGKRIGLMVCGPAAFTNSFRMGTIYHSNPFRTRFHFHSESFEF